MNEYFEQQQKPNSYLAKKKKKRKIQKMKYKTWRMIVLTTFVYNLWWNQKHLIILTHIS